MPKGVTQVRYTDAEVEQIKVLFPDLDSLKLYRRYLLDLPLTQDEITRIKATWGQDSATAVLRKTTLPEIDGTEAIGVGYDLLNNISTSEPNFDFVQLRMDQFIEAIRYMNGRLEGLTDLDTASTGGGRWLTNFVLKEGNLIDTGKTTNDLEDNTITLLKQLIIRQNVEGVLVGLQSIINQKVETEEEKAKRVAADSAQ